MKRRYPQLSEHYTARAHLGIAPRFPTLSVDRPRTCPGHLWSWYPFFHIFLFSIPLTWYARYAPGGKKIPFLSVFNYADDVQAPMRHAPPPPPRVCIWLKLKAAPLYHYFLSCELKFSHFQEKLHVQCKTNFPNFKYETNPRVSFIKILQ